MSAREEARRQRLLLVVPAGVTPAELEETLAAGDVAAVVLAPAPRLAALVDAAQREGVAALVAVDGSAGGAPPWPLGYGADGLHLANADVSAEAIVRARPEGATVGAAVASRHDAMTLGEAGADYVWFGSVDALDETGLEHACWWQALFEVPAVAAGPADPEAVRRLLATRVEFIAVNVFDADSPPARVRAINDALDAAAGSR